MRVIATGFVLVWVLVAPRMAAAETFNAGPADDVEGMINALAAGDELVLGDGTYTLHERFSFSLVGTANEPIIIRAADGADPHFHRPNASQNIWDIDNAEHVVLRGLRFSGGSAGVRISGASHLTIEDCEIHDTGDVALRANDSDVFYDSVQILRNHIHHTNNTGEGMYLGCNNDGCRIANWLIEGNYIHHTNQASVSQGDGIEIKEGSYGNIVRDNVIHDTNYPCILTYSVVGNGPANILERNAMWNCGDHAIQSAADATIRNNIILSANQDGIAMQPHQAGTPSNLVVVHNTIIKVSNDAISLRGATGSVLIANNAIYAQSGNALYVGGSFPGLTVAGNVGMGGVSGASGGYTEGALSDLVNGNWSGAPPIDVFPAPGGALVGSGDAAHVALDDFNGAARDGVADVGAYRFTGSGNPGWVLGEAFKGETPTITRPSSDDGCGCQTTSGGLPGGLLLLLLLVVWGRGRSRSIRSFRCR